MTRSMKSSFDMFASDVHILAITLDLFVSTERYIDVCWLLNGRSVVAVAQAKLEQALKNSLLSSNQISDISRSLEVWDSKFRKKPTSFSSTYHPYVWQSTIRIEQEPKSVSTAKRVFNLPKSSADVECSFKFLSRVYKKVWNKLLDENANQQNSIIFNSNKYERFASSVLAPKRCSPAKFVLCHGFDK